ncbi:MAG: hypothetical protein K0Q72_4844 [Armatimonadetes bacterium]|jgi:hypothetical protein|nr:hypothetical protein [Armatimonadota bacterium]
MPKHLSQSEHGPEPEPSRSDLNPPLELPAEDPAFTGYLDEVCAPLARLAPEYWVSDLRAELAMHLECTAEAFEELGESRRCAVASACRTLGDPERLGQRWERHWREKLPEPFRKTFRLAFRHYSTAALISVGVLLLSSHHLLNGPPNGANFGDLLRILGVLVMPVLAAAQFAQRSRGRRVLASAAAVAAVAAATAVIGGLLPGPDPGGFRPFFWQMELVYWLPIGCATAGITTLLQARKERRRQLSGG